MEPIESQPIETPKPNPRHHLQSGLASVMLVSLIFGAIGGGAVTALIDHGVFGSWWDQISGTTNGSNGTLTQSLKVTEDSATTDVVEKVQPAVVSVIGKQDLSQIRQSPFGFIFGQPAAQGKQQVSGGSGFIIRDDGLIVTNKHVVDQDGVDYSVVLHDGTEYDATIVDIDPTNDLAFLDIDAKDLPTVSIGDSDTVKVGQTVIAIGNALGQFENSVTRGVVSGLDRTIQAGSAGSAETLEDTIQTDAAINFGNSGGPLLNLAGQVIGVNTAISAEGQTIGFAIPINQAKTDITSIQEKGSIVRPFLGIRYTIVNDQLKKTNNLSVDYGAIIVRGSSPDQLAVVPGSPADKAGLEENDIILELDGKKITEDQSLGRILADHKPSDVVTLKVLHDGDEKTVEATLAEQPK